MDAYDPEQLPRKEPVGFDAFAALDLRVGVVTHVEDFTEARMDAWKVAVDFGPAVGTLHSAARVKNYEPEDLLGRRVVGAINLGTKKIAGFESQFLILGGMDRDGSVRLMGVDEPIAPGAPVA